MRGKAALIHRYRVRILSWDDGRGLQGFDSSQSRAGAFAQQLLGLSSIELLDVPVTGREIRAAVLTMSTADDTYTLEMAAPAPADAGEDQGQRLRHTDLEVIQGRHLSTADRARP
jgi:hypothetical protein